MPLIDTNPLLAPMFNTLPARLLPDSRAFHMVDESLIGNTIRAGGLQKVTIRRIVNQIESARNAGEAAIRQNGEGAWFKSEYTQTLSTHWQARASFTLIRGGANDFLGQYRRNSHAILAMPYSF